MKKDITIEFKNVTKKYNLTQYSKKGIINLLLNKKNTKKKIVLENISFQISKGESVAILGKNGMGKSTIIKLLSGISYPTEGEIITKGKVSSILELNAGFETDFTGRENIYLKCQILDLTKEETDKIINSIIDFADIGEYIDEPVRTYSSGMRARLGFAISVHIKPDILAVDEVFSVGDYNFKQKCFNKIKEIKDDENVTFILVTHSPEIAEEFCTRGMLLEKGKIIYDGNIKTCINKYIKQ